ncbi:MAG: STAS domain-containing protein [Candidatus Gracilibacteria bacterium]|jgi:anti-anti-sigma factor|nr:STAS domain-containing protein [Candidatus Gracilibacteria bacterium]
MFKSNFKFKSKTKEGYLIFEFTGDWDKLALTEKKLELNQIINDFNGKTIIFDFTDLSYINSEAIGYLMQINGFLLSIDKIFVLVGVKKNVKDILEAIGIFEIIPAYSTVKEVLNS